MQNVIKKLKQNIYEAGKMMPGMVSESVKGWEESREEQETTTAFRVEIKSKDLHTIAKSF